MKTATHTADSQTIERLIAGIGAGEMSAEERKSQEALEALAARMESHKPTVIRFG